MISLETCSGDNYQTICINDDDMKYIKNPPSKYPKFDPHENKYLHKMLYKIFVKTNINLLSDGVKVNLDGDIDFNKNVLQLVFDFEYYCYYNHPLDILKSAKYKFTNNINLEMELQSLVLDNIKKDCSGLNLIPDELKTEEICRLAITRYDGIMLFQIPYSMRTTRMCIHCISCVVNYNSIGSILQFVPNEILADVTKDMLKDISLKIIPTKFRTPQICMNAIEINSMNLKYVPYKFRTKEICKIAFEKNVHSIFYIPEKLRTEELYMTAVKKDPTIIFNIPEEMITEELYMTAVKKDPTIICNFPEEMITEEICKIAVKYKGELLKFVPYKFKTEEISRLATHNNRLNVIYVPYEMQYLFM